MYTILYNFLIYQMNEMLIYIYLNIYLLTLPLKQYKIILI